MNYFYYLQCLFKIKGCLIKICVVRRKSETFWSYYYNHWAYIFHDRLWHKYDKNITTDHVWTTRFVIYVIWFISHSIFAPDLSVIMTMWQILLCDFFFFFCQILKHFGRYHKELSDFVNLRTRSVLNLDKMGYSLRFHLLGITSYEIDISSLNVLKGILS